MQSPNVPLQGSAASLMPNLGSLCTMQVLAAKQAEVAQVEQLMRDALQVRSQGALLCCWGKMVASSRKGCRRQVAQAGISPPRALVQAAAGGLQPLLQAALPLCSKHCLPQPQAHRQQLQHCQHSHCSACKHRLGAGMRLCSRRQQRVQRDIWQAGRGRSCVSGGLSRQLASPQLKVQDSKFGICSQPSLSKPDGLPAPPRQ